MNVKKITEVGLNVNELKLDFTAYALGLHGISSIKFGMKDGEITIAEMKQFKNHPYPLTLPKLQLIFQTYLIVTINWKEKYNKLLDSIHV